MTSYFRYLISEGRRLGLYLAILIAIISFGCGSNSNTQSTEKKPSDTQSAENLSVPLPPELGKYVITDKNLIAELLIDDKYIKNLDVNPTNKSVSGNIDKVKDGTHKFEIIYYIIDESDNKIKVATASTNAIIAAGTKTTVGDDDDRFIFNYHDDDNDGFTNLAELDLKTNYNDWKSRPLAELPRHSDNYILSDTMGISPTVVGKSESNNYVLY